MNLVKYMCIDASRLSCVYVWYTYGADIERPLEQQFHVTNSEDMAVAEVTEVGGGCRW